MILVQDNIDMYLYRQQAFVHVSTSYCHCGEDVLEEYYYPAPQDPIRIMQLTEWMDPEILNLITPK